MLSLHFQDLSVFSIWMIINLLLLKSSLCAGDSGVGKQFFFYYHVTPSFWLISTFIIRYLQNTKKPLFYTHVKICLLNVLLKNTPTERSVIYSGLLSCLKHLTLTLTLTDQSPDGNAPLQAMVQHS